MNPDYSQNFLKKIYFRLQEKMKKNKILIVDDQPDNLYILNERLGKVGFDVITAGDGYQAVEKAINEQPDLILLDIMMPGISGFETCSTLIANERTKNIPVILVTALSGPEDIKKGLQSGAFDYIKKPFNNTELIARISSALRFSAANKRLLELEKINTFAATVITADHEIKQPLTLINLSIAAIKRHLSQEEPDKDMINKKVVIIENAARSINTILEKLRSIKNPVFMDYVNNLKMIVLNSEKENISE